MDEKFVNNFVMDAKLDPKDGTFCNPVIEKMFEQCINENDPRLLIRIPYDTVLGTTFCEC